MSNSFKSGCNNTAIPNFPQYFREKIQYPFKGHRLFQSQLNLFLFQECAYFKDGTFFDVGANGEQRVGFEPLTKVDLLPNF